MIEDEAPSERHQRVNAYAVRIREAVEQAGFDPRMLNELSPAHVIAALILGVK